tara:strand:+ start:70 stop:363 length:294 start_codon:yes stop_codon:yes gene_type:complete
MAQFDNAVSILNIDDFLGYRGNPPVNEAEYNERKGAMFSKDAPTWSDIEAKINLLNIQNARKEEYPSIADQLDDIYHNGINAWKATIKVTKDKYPKS